MKNTIRVALAATGLAFAGSAALAAPCATDTARDQITSADAEAIYACLSARMQKGYQKGPKRWIPKSYVAEYRNWTRVSTLPAEPGVHGGRFLLTYVNDKGADAYLEFKEEGARMPVGTVIAKESFSINGKGKGSPGPLFIMERVADEQSPETKGWYYMMVSPKGQPQAVNVVTACADCHNGFEGQDSLGYPEEEVRLSR